MRQTSNTKASAVKTLLIPALAVLLPLQPVLQAASSLPTGGSFTSGSGSISASGNVLTINQNSLKGIVDWNTFSIGKGSTVTFKNGSGATLNLVTGTTPSTLLGQLLATGSVYLLNPEGILIGKGATVHTGGDFVATTLTVPNAQFLSNAPLLFSGPSEATVVNLGTISSNGGNVYLIGHTVQNSGSVYTLNGTTGLAAGSQVLITDPSSGQKVAVDAPGGDVTNTGFIHAAQVELKSNGGNIYALAGSNGGFINATGTANIDGHVWLIATNGTTTVSSAISATNTNGQGGAIETSGSEVNAGGAQIRTGKGGSWLLDPDDLTIDSTLAATIDSTLNGGTNVTEQTGSGNTGNGDLTVASPIAWTTGADLTLSAFRNVVLNAGISNAGSGNLTVRADNTSTGTGTISGSGLIDWSVSTGTVALLYNPSSYATPTSYTANFGSVNGSWTVPANGSVSSQYTAYMLVNSAANLQNLDANDAGTYALGQDIDLSSIANFIPLGTTYPHFTGILDGMGHTISNLTINSGAYDVGLFADLANGSKVRNLSLTNVNVTATGNEPEVGSLAGATGSSTISNVSVAGLVTLPAAGYYSGGLVGENDGTIQNSSSSVNIDASTTTSGYLSAGGLAGTSSGPVLNSSASGTVNAPTAPNAYLGGLVGYNYGSSTISNSYATGSVTGGGDSQVGGLAGYSSAAITNSYATGHVTAGNYISVGTYAGGLVGFNDTGSTISGSYATGPVSIGSGTTAFAGGLLGSDGAAISNSYATGTVSGAGRDVGGLVGYTTSGTPIASSYATGAVASSGSTAYVGGLVGISNSAISLSHATGAVGSTSAYGWLGGLVGYATGGSISTSYATGSLTTTGSETYVAGGLVGYSDIGITNSYATGAVNAAINSDYVGGLVGWTDGAVSGSHATGAVSGGGAITGGLAGGNSQSISNSYATGSVTAGDNADVGGLVGYGYGPISLSYAIGSVTAGNNSTVGGLAGYASATIANTYAHGQVTGGSGSMVGGLIGQLDTGGSLATSYSSGHVLATGSTVGGLIGNNTSGATITSSYWDDQASGFLTTGVGSGNSSNVTPKTTAQLQSGNLPGGFDPTIWTAPSNFYPFFGWQGSLVTISGTAYNGSSVIASATVDALTAGFSLGSVTTNSNGVYTFGEPGNMFPTGAGVLTYLASNGTANTFSDGGGTNNYTGMDLHVGTLNLISSSATMSGLNAALASTLGNNTGVSFLFTQPAGSLSLVSGTNLTLRTSAASFNLDQAISTTGNVLINAAGNLSITANSGLAGNNITLVTGGAFTNNDGPSAISTSNSGIWSIYSQNPANDTTGGLPPAFVQYNATYGVTTPDASGNGLFYTLAPVITPSLSGTVSKTYNGNTIATLSPSNLIYAGSIQGDTVDLSATSAAYASAAAGTDIGVTASGIGIQSAFNGSIPVYGYQLAATIASANIGTILAATPTPTPTPTPAPTPTPKPTPTPTPNPTTLTFIIGNTTDLQNSKPVFTATYTGPAINGLNIASILAGLKFTITPAISGSGTYTITATGTAPDGYTIHIAPATLTIVDSTSATLPTQAPLITPVTPELLPAAANGAEASLLQPLNSVGLFQVQVTGTGNNFGASFIGFGTQQTPLAQSSYFGTNDKKDTYSAGAKP